MQRVLTLVLTVCLITAPISGVEIAAGAQAGALTITAEDRNGHDVSGATVVLYDSNWEYVDEKTTDSTGDVSWTGKSGTYHVELYNNDEFWGGAAPDAPADITITRKRPYETQVQLTEETADGVHEVGETINIAPQIHNAKDYTQTVRVEILVDTDGDSSAETSVTRGPIEIVSHSERWYGYDFSPESGGKHRVRVRVETETGGGWALTDDTGWTTPFTVETPTTNYELSVASESGGGLEIYPPGLSTASGYTATYEEGTVVDLTARPGSGTMFSGWEGDIPSSKADQRSISVTMDQARSLRATFQQETVQASIREFTVRADTYQPGESVPATLTIENTGTSDHRFWVDFSAQQPSGGWSLGEGEFVDMRAGETRAVDLSWVVPNNPESGLYDGGTAVYKSDGKDIKYDGASEFDAFEVAEPTIEYDLTVESDSGGGIGVNPPGLSTTSYSGAYEEGTEVEVSATSRSGYTFAGWEGDISSSVADQQRITVTMNQARSLRATFQQETTEYAFSATTETGGGLEISPPGLSTASGYSTTYEEGTVVDLTARSASEYTFTGWEGDIAPSKTDQRSISVTMDQALSLRATFQEEIAEYELSVSSGSGGGLEIYPPGLSTASGYSNTYEEGTVIDLTARSGTDYRFSGWEGDIASAKADQQSISVTMDQARSLRATFEETTSEYAFSVTAETGGGLEIYPPGLSTQSGYDTTYEEETVVDLTARSASGYRFSGWEGDIASSKTDQRSISVTMNQARSLEATFAEETTEYAFSATTETGGGLEIYPPGLSTASGYSTTYEEGTSVDLTARSGSEYTFTGWEGDIPSSKSADKSISVTMDQARSLRATFEQEMSEFELSVASESGGGLEISPPGLSTSSAYSRTYEEGTVVELTARPSADYVFTGWKGNIAPSKADNKSISVRMDEAHSLEATFAEEPTEYAFSATTETGGGLEIYPPGLSTTSGYSTTYEEGTVVDITARSGPEYTFTGWSGDIAPSKTDQRAISVTMDQARSLRATFEEEVAEYELSVSSESGGGVEISPPGLRTSSAYSRPYEEGTVVELTARPDADYVFTGWKGDIAPAKTDQRSIRVTVGQARSISATFEEATTEYAFSATAETGGGLEISPPGLSTASGYSTTYEEGTVVDLTARSASGYTFAGWEGEIAPSKAENTSISVRMNQARSLTAAFEEEKAEYKLIAAASAGGGVEITPPGRSTSNVLSTTYEEETVVELTARAGSGYVFTGWRGIVANAKTDQRSLNVTMDQPRSLRATFEPEESAVRLETVAFDASPYQAGERAEGQVVIRNSGDTTNTFSVGVQAVGPSGQTYSLYEPTTEGVRITANEVQTVDISRNILQAYPPGAYDIRVRVWDAEEGQSAGEFVDTTRQSVFEVEETVEERASLTDLSVEEDYVLPAEDADVTLRVSNTGSETRTFTIQSALRTPNGLRATGLTQSQEVTLAPGNSETIQFTHALPADATSGEYDVVATVSQDGTQVTTQEESGAFEVAFGDSSDVEVAYVNSKWYGEPGDSIPVTVGLTTGEQPARVALTLSIRDPTGETYTISEKQKVLDLESYGFKRTEFTIPVTDTYPSGEYDILVSAESPATGGTTYARTVEDSAFKIESGESGSITVEPVDTFSASVDLKRNGKHVATKIITRGTPETFEQLPAGEYTIRYQTYEFGGGDTVERQVELSESQQRTIEISPERASLEGQVRIAGQLLKHATVKISGESVDTGDNGNFQSGPALSPGFHTLIVEFDDRIIHREGIEIEAGQNELDLNIEYVDPRPGDEFDGEEMLLGFWCGDFCYGDDGNGHANAEFMLGWMLGSLNPAFDVRDALSATSRGDAVGVGVSVIGLAPYLGDVPSFGSRIIRFVKDAPPQQIYRFTETVRKSKLNKKDEILDTIRQAENPKTVLKNKFGFSRSTRQRLPESSALKLRVAGSRLIEAGYSEEVVAKFLRRNSNKISKIDEISHAAKYYRRTTGSAPNSNAELLESIWFNRIRQSENAKVAPHIVDEGSKLETGQTYVTSGVDLVANRGELDVVVFSVDDAGDIAVTKAYEVGGGSLANKPSNQLRTNLGAAEDVGSESHHYLNSKEFTARSSDSQYGGYAGLTDEYRYNLAEKSVPETGHPIYTSDEITRMSRDLNVDKIDDWSS